jgi:hypothetical protein
MEINIVNTTIFAAGLVPFDLNSANHRLHFRYQNNRICSNKQRMSTKCARKYISTILYFVMCLMDRKPKSVRFTYFIRTTFYFVPLIQSDYAVRQKNFRVYL